MLDLYRKTYPIAYATALTICGGGLSGMLAGSLASYPSKIEGWGVGVAVGVAYITFAGTVLLREGFRAQAAYWAARVSRGAINVIVEDNKVYPLDKDDKPIKNATATIAPALNQRVIRNLVTPAIPSGFAVSELQLVADEVIFNNSTFRLVDWVGTKGQRKPFTRPRWERLRYFFYKYELAEDAGWGARTGLRWTDRGLEWFRDVHARYGPALH